MKKVHLIAALSGFLLVSCAQDDLVVKPGSPTDGSPVTFAMNIGNSSRSETKLENAGFNSFGVWAVKAADKTTFLGLDLNLGDDAMSPNVVMNDYWVKYCTNLHYGSYWSYVPDDWTSNLEDKTQFLKYWDGSFAHTYFVAYAPATANASFTNKDNASGKPVLTFSTPYTTSANAPLAYSEIKEVDNSQYVTGSVTSPQTVPLKFHYILSQVKIAFWEDIPGYKVELEEVTFADNTTAGIAAIPADVETDPTATPVNTWSRGKYISAGYPVVTYNESDFTKASFAFENCETSSGNLNFALPASGEELGSTSSDAVYSPSTFNVLPNVPVGTSIPSYLQMATNQTWTKNSGLQFVVNYKLMAEDTKEVIHVRGARVYVPAKYTAWAPNTLYTYIFHITTNSSGTTTSTNPVNNPEEPVPGLYPIIFDGLKIVDLATEKSLWDINQQISLTANPGTSIEVGGTTELTVKCKFTDETIDYNSSSVSTWSSSDTDIATVSGAGVVTGIAAGHATIYVKTINGLTASIGITVTTPTVTP